MADSSSASAAPALHKFQICGVHVEFPHKPYAPQLAFMGKVLAALEQSRLPHRSASVNALLESPTGSGKTLALLCATLAWQSQFHSLPPPPAGPVNPLLSGGGFIRDDLPPGPDIGVGGISKPAADTSTPGRFNNHQVKRRRVPTIYYASRTHTQITQVIREFRKTKYRATMAVLGARKHYCTNKLVVKRNNVDEDCKQLMKDAESCCPQFKNVSKLKTHASLQKGGSNDVHDIEDLVGLGHKVKGCAYFAARALAAEADIVFCPYSYILDPIIRRAMEVNLQGAIVILDEAHNIEDVAREAGSIDLETNSLQDLRMELELLSSSDETTDIYSPLLEMVQALLGWIHHQEANLSKLDFEHFASSWRGAKAVQELRAAGICLETFQVLINCSNQAVGASSNPDETVNRLSGLSATALEGLFSALKFMLLDNGRRAGDYQMVVKKFVKRDEGLAVAGWVTMLSLWCLNPGVVFQDIASSTRSIILTSGTLSPMDSFASELGVPFEYQMEAPHVVDMEKQVWAAAVSTGPDNISLNASYKNAEGYAFQIIRYPIRLVPSGVIFQMGNCPVLLSEPGASSCNADALGIVLEEVFKVVPDGALTFFPSYKLLDKVCARWKSTGQWSRMANTKELFVEPRGNTDQFELVLQRFYDAVNSDTSTPNKVRKVRPEMRVNLKRQNVSRNTGGKASGAAFLAVCRGKVSEGIDFADKNARIVVIVGIPFPNVKDIKVTMKKQYNQENRVLKKLLSGDEWYCQQTFRALNQAVGRCIRHRNDYGAILLLDDRFKKPGNIQYMSKWLRKSIRPCEGYRESLEGLKAFFKGFESITEVKDMTSLPTLESVMVSTPKAKLPIASPSSKPENRCNLKDYFTNAGKGSPGVHVNDFISGSVREPAVREQVVYKNNVKAALEIRPHKMPAHRQTKRLVIDPIDLSRPEVVAPAPIDLSSPEVVAPDPIDLSSPEVVAPEAVEQGGVALDLLDEDADSEYEIFSLRNDRSPWMNEIVRSDVEKYFTGNAKVVNQHDASILTRSRKTSPESENLSEISKLGESAFEGEIYLGQSKNMNPCKRKLDGTCEEIAFDKFSIPLKSANSTGLDSPVRCAKMKTANLHLHEGHVPVVMYDQSGGAKDKAHCNLFAATVPTTQSRHHASSGARAVTPGKAKLKLQRTKFDA